MSTPSVSRIVASSVTVSSESPPRSKKLSCRPTLSTPSVSPNSAATCRSVSVCGSAYSARSPAPSVTPSLDASPILWILPVAPLGISSRNRICSGTLKDVRRCAVNSRSPLAVVDAPGRSTTAAATASPSVRCGAANATACPTAGCASSASSISRGAIFSPPRLMISFRRPVRNRYPSSSRYPWSPVRNQPLVNERWFASGLSAYPGVTFSPRITASPVAPGASSVPSSSMIATSGPAAMPTEPALRLAGGSGFEAIWCAASVIPYASITGTPKIDSISSISDGGNAEEHERINRKPCPPATPGSAAARAAAAW